MMVAVTEKETARGEKEGVGEKQKKRQEMDEKMESGSVCRELEAAVTCWLGFQSFKKECVFFILPLDIYQRSSANSFQ